MNEGKKTEAEWTNELAERLTEIRMPVKLSREVELALGLWANCGGVMLYNSRTGCLRVRVLASEG